MLETLPIVKEAPVLYSVDGQILTSDTHKVMYNAEDGHHISVMKSSYCPMLNEDFMETTQRMADISGFKFEGYTSIDNGRIVMSHLRNNAEGKIDINGHEIKDFLFLGSSFDGRYPFIVGTTTLLIRCQNQFSKINQVANIKHTKSSAIKREQLMRSLEVYFEDRKKMYERLRWMCDVEMNDESQRIALDYVLKISAEDRLEGLSTRKTNQLEMLRNNVSIETTDLGNTRFAVMQGVTRFTTHDFKKKEEVFGNVFGTANEFNQRAYSLLSVDVAI